MTEVTNGIMALTLVILSVVSAMLSTGHKVRQGHADSIEGNKAGSIGYEIGAVLFGVGAIVKLLQLAI